ncbi:tetratricopeptide repeat protein [Nonomuraea purpurea]|uniref:Tetratricopeptide repeat protein n=1 Tax=Nonomuraea purpurea TaxID=1849276 RepID=A0ABV8FYA7_9ACTN
MASEQLSEAMSCWKSGDLDQAAALFRQIAATGDPQASHLLAGVLHEQGDLEGAEAAHRSVIQSGDPVYGQRSAIAMGMMLVTAKEWPAAHRVLSIASDGADFEVAALADTALVMVLTQLGDVQGAQEALRRARRCDTPAVAELAAQLELPDFRPDPSSARDLYEAAEDEDDYRALLTCGDPDVVSLSAFQLYTLYAEEEEFEAAREVCEHAIAVGGPDHLAMAHKLLGAVLVDLGEYAESASAYRVAAEDHRPEIRLPSLIELAKVTAQLGDVEETKAIFRRVIAGGQREHVVQAQACLAQMHTEAGEAPEALAMLRAVIEADEEEWGSICVALLGLLADQCPQAYDEVMELARLAAGHQDPDTAFKARLLLEHAARQQPLADPVAEQALQDTDEGLARLKDGDLAGARELLRRAADSEAADESLRAMVALAQLELGEGDREQADELLAYVAEGDDLSQGFHATFLLHLVRESGDERHPVLEAMLAHQRQGREEGLLRYQEATRHPDPSVSAIGTAVFAQVLVSLGFDLSESAEMLQTAAGSGDPFALSYAALMCREVTTEDDTAVEVLRRAMESGHPVLAPWVAHALGTLVAERDPGEARRAYEAALDGGVGGIRFTAAADLVAVLEQQGDLLAATRVHERLLAEGMPERVALPLAYTWIRLEDIDAARAAFAADPGELGEFGRALLGRDFDGAARAIPEGRALSMASMLAMESAHVWQRTGQSAAADAALSLVVAVGDPGMRQQAGCLLGAVRNEAGDKRGAVDTWLRAAAGEDEEQSAVALRAAGDVLQELGEHAEAAELFTRVLDHVDDGADDRVALILRLGQSLIACGRKEEARERLAEVAGANATFFYAHYLREHGDPEGALAALTAAAPEPTADSERLLGTVLAETGDLEGAKAAFERAAAMEPESEPKTLLEAGRRLLEAGDTEAAHFALERAAAQDDDPYTAAVSRHLLGRATPRELPWVLVAEGDEEGALAALTEETGSERMAALLIALHDVDVRAVRRLLTESAPEERASLVTETYNQVGETDGDARIELLRLVVELGDADLAARAGFQLGVLYANESQNNRAELSFLPVTEHLELGQGAWRNIAIVRKRRGDLDGAIEAARRGLPATAAFLAELLEERGEAAGARDVLAAAAADGDLRCLQELLTLLARMNEHDAVMAHAEPAVATGDPETVAIAYWTWGDAYEAKGDTHNAALMYRKGVDTGFPGTTDSIRVDLATALRRLGDTEGASAQARLAIESGDSDAVSRGGSSLGMWLYEDGDHLGAAQAFAAAAGTDTTLAESALRNLDILAYQAAERGEHPLAMQMLALMGEHAAEVAQDLGDRCEDPDAVRAYYELSDSGAFTELRIAERLADLGETAQARAIYERLNEHENPDVRFVAGGRLLSLLDDAGDSEAFYNVAQRQAGDADSPVQGVFGSLLGMLQSRQGDTEESLRTLRAAAESGEPTALAVFAQTLVDAGEVEEGRRVYLRVLDAGDADLAARAMVALGRTHHDEDGELAREWYLKAVEAGESHVSALAAMYLGALAKQNRDFPEALTWYQRVIDSGDPESGLAAAHLGELCYWLGDRDGALRFYELTLTLTEQPDLVAEAACRLGEIRYERGDLALARRMLEIAVETGDESFAPQAGGLLDKLAPN